MKALVIDDNQVSANDLARKLKYYELEVVTAYSGEEGLAIFEKSGEKEYDVIFLDIMMPEKKGTEISAMIRGMEREDAKAVPIIAVTGINYDALNRAMDVSGFNGLLPKPTDMNVLKGILESLGA